ncbi:MAG: hypothetical protein AAF636_11520 [Pseudomonadota bacterium]
MPYIRENRVFDGGNLTFDQQPDLSPENNNATLYSGRYQNWIVGEGVRVPASGSRVLSTAVTFYARGTGTITFDHGGSTSNVGVTSAGAWALQSNTLSSSTIENITITSGSLDIAYITFGNIVDRIRLWDKTGTLSDGNSIIADSGGLWEAVGTPVGGTGETDIPQSAADQWNRGGSANFNADSFSFANAIDGGTASTSKFDFEVTSNFGGQYIQSGLSLQVGDIVRVSLSNVIVSSSALNLSSRRDSAAAITGTVTNEGGGVYTITLTVAVANWALFANIVGGGTGESVQADVSFEQIYADVLIPPSLSSSSNDAIGNPINASSQRLTAQDVNTFEDISTEWAELPDNANLESIRTISLPIYNDGSSKDIVQTAGGASMVDIASNTLQTDQAGTHTFYVNGAAATALNAGWNYLTIVFNSGKDLSGGKYAGLIGKLIAYSPKALTADEASQNFNAFKSKYQI